MYGAGNIGRGFIGQLFADSGYEVTFIDVAEPVIEALNRDGRYPIRFLSNDGCRDIWVSGVRAINGSDKEKASEAIAGADIMATAVGVRILPHIAPLIAEGIKKRFARTKDPLNIIICENLIEADKLLEKLIKENLNREEQRLFDERIGLAEASIGRMVPIQTAEMQGGNLLRICCEEYGFLPVDGNAFRGVVPVIKGMTAFDNFHFFIEQKLFIHNMGHGICAYLGMYLGDKYIYETVNRNDILFIAKNAMTESARALSKKHKMPIAGIQDHIRDLLSRFGNRALGDTCARVGADTERKIAPNDRFIGAVRLCEEEGQMPVFISIGAAAALYRFIEEKNYPQSRKSAEKILTEFCALPDSSPGRKNILLMYSILSGQEASVSVLERLIQAALSSANLSTALKI